MQQIEITDEALPILKSGIALKKKLLTSKADDYLNRLKTFEKKHKMKSEAFFEASLLPFALLRLSLRRVENGLGLFAYDH